VYSLLFLPFPFELIFEIAGPEKAKNLADKRPSPDSESAFATPSIQKLFSVCQNNSSLAQSVSVEVLRR
jgi:hypothetical protein